jgi:3',5'-cyclic-AMP phosphodiesterase
MKKSTLPLGKALITTLLSASLLSTSCMPEFTPFGTDVPDEARDLTRKNLEKLSQRRIPGDTFKVVLVSDPQRNPFAFDDVLEKINLRKDLDEVAFVAVLGDITNQGYLFEYEWAYNALKKLDVPYFGVIGNHDSISNGKEIFGKMFGPFDYVIDYKNTRFIAYNDNRFEFPNAPNKNWIYAQADEALGRDHVITLSHVPILEDASEEERTEFVAELKARGVRHMWSGHVHLFEYSEKDDMTFFSVTKVKENTLHYAVLTVRPDGVDYEECTPNCARVSGR